MWKCKKCGKKVVAQLEFNDTLSFTLKKNKDLDEFDSFCDLEQVIKSGGFVIGYRCCDCDQESEELEEIAIWED